MSGLAATEISADGWRTRTRGKWKFVGQDGSKGYRNGVTYLMDVYVNHDPDDFFIYTHALRWRGFRTDDTFYGSHEAFDSNWECEGLPSRPFQGSNKLGEDK